MDPFTANDGIYRAAWAKRAHTGPAFEVYPPRYGRTVRFIASLIGSALFGALALVIIAVVAGGGA